MARSRSSGLATVFTALVLVVLLGAASALFGVCGPFTDVAADAFCPFVLEIFSLGITTGTTPTTYDPTASVTRLQMAAFLSRTVDRTLQRGGRRAALDQFWTPQNDSVLGTTPVGTIPELLGFDGADLWVANKDSASVSRVRASDGKLLGTWTGAVNAFGVLVAMGRVFATGITQPGRLYQIDPTEAAGAVTTVASNLGDQTNGIAFDGARIWTANFEGASVSIVTPGAALPWTVTTVGGFSFPAGVLYDGSNIWVTDQGHTTLVKLDTNGAILQSVTVGTTPEFPVFDGTNIWVPNHLSASVSVVRASTGAVLATLTGNGVFGPFSAAFDGARVLVTDFNVDRVSLWKAADLTPLGSFPTGAGSTPIGACSDGVNFWITLGSVGTLARF